MGRSMFIHVTEGGESSFIGVVFSIVERNLARGEDGSDMLISYRPAMDSRGDTAFAVYGHGDGAEVVMKWSKPRVTVEVLSMLD